MNEWQQQQNNIESLRVIIRLVQEAHIDLAEKELATPSLRDTRTYSAIQVSSACCSRVSIHVTSQTYMYIL